MDYSPLLPPVVALVAWTLVIFLWMLIARGGAFRRGVSFSNIPAGSRGVDLDGKGEERAQWKSHNYNHLMEQPTIFYAIVLASAMMGMDQPINVYLAWGYVGFRVIHSLIQCTANVVRFRFLAFMMASLCLMGITLHAAARVIHDCLAAM